MWYICCQIKNLYTIGGCLGDIARAHGGRARTLLKFSRRRSTCRYRAQYTRTRLQLSPIVFSCCKVVLQVTPESRHDAPSEYQWHIHYSDFNWFVRDYHNEADELRVLFWMSSCRLFILLLYSDNILYGIYIKNKIKIVQSCCNLRT